MLTREELLEIGVNPDNMTYPLGEMNVIVQRFGYEDGTFMNEDGEEWAKELENYLKTHGQGGI